MFTKEISVLASLKFPKIGIEMLKDAGFIVTEWTERRPMTPEELIKNAQKHNALFSASSDKLDENFLRSCSHLDLISQFSVGYDNIDLGVAKELNIPFGNAPGAMVNATSDVAFGLMISVSRKMFHMHKLIEQSNWKFFHPEDHLGQELYGKTLGVFGLGKIGMEMARKCKSAFGMDVIYCNRNPNKAAQGKLAAELVSFPDLLKRSDVLSVHCPLNDETRGLFDFSAFKKMKSSSIFINTSRGGVHNEEDLILALEKKMIWGAGLDVTDPEPMSPDNPLLKMESACVLPHIGSATVEARNRMSEYAAKNIIEYYKTGQVAFPVS